MIEIMIRFLFAFLLIPILAFGFPDDATIDDDFNRTDEDPIAGIWTDLTFGDGGCAVVSNTAQKSGGGAGSCYVTTEFATGNQEAFATLPSQDSHSTSTSVYVLVCVQDEGTTGGDAYSIRVREDTNDDQIQFRRWDDGAETVLGSNIDVEFGDGDKMGIKYTASSGLLEAWADVGSGWVQQGTTTDSNLTCTDTHIGIVVAHSSGVMDDFGGGEVVEATSTFFQMLEFK